MAIIFARYLQELRLIDLRGVIATLAPSFDRARLMRGTLDLLGMPTVPVGVGTDGGDTLGRHKADRFESTARSYLPSLATVATSSSILPGRKLLFNIFDKAAPRSLVLLLIASVKDAAGFLRDNAALFVAKTREVVIMGGVASAEAGAALAPDSAHNNARAPASIQGPAARLRSRRGP